MANLVFVDTEYNWSPRRGQITPISIGLVGADGRECYAVDANWRDDAGDVDPYVEDVVVPALTALDGEPHFPPLYVHGERATITRAIISFVGTTRPEFWGDYAAFDYVVLSMLMGDFADWPDGWPMHINDCQQAGIPSGESRHPHHALADARAVRDAWESAGGAS